MVRVAILDMTDNWEQEATLADDVPLRLVMGDLLRELSMPEKGAHGEKVSYGLCVEGQRNLLDPERTLRDNNVWDGTRLRLLASFTVH